MAERARKDQAMVECVSRISYILQPIQVIGHSSGSKIYLISLSFLTGIGR